MEKTLLFRANPELEFFTTENCHILENSNSLLDPDCSIARARVAPRTTTEWHRLEGTTERYLIISGKGRVETGSLLPTIVEAGDVVVIPPDEPQRIENLGDEDLVFYCICTPRFQPSCYQTL